MIGKDFHPQPHSHTKDLGKWLHYDASFITALLEKNYFSASFEMLS